MIDLSSEFIRVKDKIKNKCRDMSLNLSPTIKNIYAAYDIDYYGAIYKTVTIKKFDYAR